MSIEISQYEFMRYLAFRIYYLDIYRIHPTLDSADKWFDFLDQKWIEFPTEYSFVRAAFIRDLVPQRRR